MLSSKDFSVILQSCYERPDPRLGMLYLSLLFILLALGLQIGGEAEDEEQDRKLAKRYCSLSRVAVTKFVYDCISNGPPSHDDLLGVSKCLVSVLCIFSLDHPFD